MADDIRGMHGISDAPVEVYHADSRVILDVLEPNSIDAVITSPPYPNEKDYTRTTRLESVLLGFIRDKAELKALKRGRVAPQLTVVMPPPLPPAVATAWAGVPDAWARPRQAGAFGSTAAPASSTGGS